MFKTYQKKVPRYKSVWKCCFGSDVTFLEGYVILIKKHLAGTDLKNFNMKTKEVHRDGQQK